MLRYKTNFLRHIDIVNAWVRKHGATATLDPRTLDMVVTLGGRSQPLHAVFVGKTGSRPLYYTRSLDWDVIGFVGWFPYEPRAWPLSTSKRAFKAFAREQGIPVAEDWLDPRGIDGPFITKKDQSSFGRGIRGPYDERSRAGVPALEPGEYCERLILGQIVRAWYWAGELAAFECFDMPTVLGDGRTSLLELARRKLAKGDELPGDLTGLFALQGNSPDDVIPIGQRRYIDYRYASPFNPTVWSNANMIETMRGSRIHDALIAAGEAMRGGLPEDLRSTAVFGLDAVADPQDKLYFLEANSSPQLHPDLYPTMLDGLLEGNRLAEGAAEGARS